MNMITIQWILTACQHANPPQHTNIQKHGMRYSMNRQKDMQKQKLVMKRTIKEYCVYCNKINAQTFAKNDVCSI